jgi:hypothetical protein
MENFNLYAAVPRGQYISVRRASETIDDVINDHSHCIKLPSQRYLLARFPIRKPKGLFKHLTTEDLAYLMYYLEANMDHFLSESEQHECEGIVRARMAIFDILEERGYYEGCDRCMEEDSNVIARDLVRSWALLPVGGSEGIGSSELGQRVRALRQWIRPKSGISIPQAREEPTSASASPVSQHQRPVAKPRTGPLKLINAATNKDITVHEIYDIIGNINDALERAGEPLLSRPVREATSEELHGRPWERLCTMAAEAAANQSRDDSYTEEGRRRLMAKGIKPGFHETYEELLKEGHVFTSNTHWKYHPQQQRGSAPRSEGARSAIPFSWRGSERRNASPQVVSVNPRRVHRFNPRETGLPGGMAEAIDAAINAATQASSAAGSAHEGGTASTREVREAKGKGKGKAPVTTPPNESVLDLPLRFDGREYHLADLA